MFSLKNKVALITGGGSGIGKAISILFGEASAIIHIVELDAKAGEKVAKEIKDFGHEAFSHKCNVSNQKEVLELFSRIGTIDILINNAGIAKIGNLEATISEDFEKLFAVNVKGAYNCMFAAITMMKKRKTGVIINISSIAAHVGIEERFAYSMSKGALHAMTLSVAKDYIKFGIRAVTISPARIHTPFVDKFIHKSYFGKEDEMFEKLSESQPIGRMGKPLEVALLALFLASAEASFITGCDYPIDGGFIHLNS
jgi:NAD(P)-dependent dehydrogenase (short-subunit alcohol dehydrogenase family)